MLTVLVDYDSGNLHSAEKAFQRMAAEVGSTVMTVYKYFPRKIDILQALWTLVFKTLFDELDDLARQHPNAAARLEAVAMGYVRFWLERRAATVPDFSQLRSAEL